MSYSKEALLKSSIKEFEDNVFNCLVYETERIITSSGFMYILKKPFPKKISCAIHYSTHWESSDEIGKIQNNDIDINTREYIDVNSIIEYKDLTIAISSQDSYNETMAQYHYRGMSTFGYIIDKFMILDEKQIEDNLAINSFPLVFDFFKNNIKYPIVPSYFNIINAISPNDSSKVITLDVSNTNCINILDTLCKIENYQKKYYYRQNNTDSIKLSFINMNQQETYSIIAEFQDFIQSNQSIGLIDKMRIYPHEYYQKSFNWKSLINICEMSINYNLEVTPDNQDSFKQIKSAILDIIRVI